MEQVGVKPYSTSLEYLFDELKLLELYLGLAVVKFRDKNKIDGKQQNEFAGMYISNEEVDLDMQFINNKNIDSGGYEILYRTIDEHKNIIEKRKRQSVDNGTQLSLKHICDVFSLSEFEKNVLLICIAPEIDLKFEKVYSYLQNDITKKKPTVGFILDLLFDSIEENISYRQYFLNERSLFRSHLIKFEQTQENQYILSKPLKIDNYIVNYILGHEQLDPDLSFCSKKFMPDNMTEDNHPRIHEKIEKNIVERIKHTQFNNKGIVFYLKGSKGIGRKTVIKSACNKISLPLLIIDIKNAVTSGLDAHKLSVLIFRQAVLLDAVIYLDNFDFLFANHDSNTDKEKIKTNYLDLIRCKLVNHNGIVFLSGEEPCGQNLSFPINIDFQLPEYQIRQEIWKFFLPEEYKDMKMIREMATSFKFTPAQIKNAILSTKSLNSDSSIQIDDLYNGCYLQCNEKLAILAKKVTKKHSLKDIILSHDKKSQLREIIAYVKNRNTVYFDWGFANKISSTDGLNVLFAGESGTGKTMAASIIANELNLEIYKIDLSSVVSKYIGETEKNLDRIFKEAQTSNSILFFDEADALFGKRSEVKDAHDRYANVEIDYLLQKLEEHKEIVILASNLSQNIDSAFARRMHFRVEFEFPDKQSRSEMWKNIFPKDAPLDKNIDFEFMSKFEVAGGNIKNIALTAAFLAADEGKEISMKHLIIATKKEYDKIGKPVTKSDFEGHYKLIKNKDENSY